MADKGKDKVRRRALGGTLPPAIVRLIDDGRRVTPGKVWRVLEEKERVASLRLLVRRRKDRDELVGIVAKVRKFRPASVRGMKNAKIVQMAMGVSLPPPLLVSMLDEMHLERRREMLAHFLGALDIPNDDGAVERFDDHDPGEREVRAAADDLVREHGLRRSVIYFLTLIVLRVRFEDHLWTWMRRLVAREDAPDADVQPAASAAARDGGVAVREPRTEYAQEAIPEEDAGEPIPEEDAGAESPEEDARGPKPDAGGTVFDRASTPRDEVTQTRPEPSVQRLAAEEQERDEGAPGREASAELPDEPAGGGDVVLEEALQDAGDPPPAAESGDPPLVAEAGDPSPAAEAADPSSGADTTDPPPTAEARPPTPLADDVDEHPVPEPEAKPTPTLRTLDNVLIRALVDSRQGVEGCLDEDQISDAVDEFVNLNGRRHQSYFHAGFRDALFGHPRPRELAAESESRLRWYWAGVVRDWARSRGSSRRIVEAYDANPVVRDLGDGGDATEEAAPDVLHALWREERKGEIVDFLKVPGMRSSSSLFDKAFDVGTALLRADDVPYADAVFDGLLNVVREFEERGLETANSQAVRRRRAHCLQRLIEYDRARQLLEELLGMEEDPDYLAMTHADLGLIAGRFSELDEVVLPARQRDLGDFIDRLRAGREHYERAVEEDVPYAAHGEYCLGIIALGEERWGDAENRLRAARARFGGTGYREALAARTDLYFGIARAAHAQRVQDLAHAAKVMAQALEAGARFPRYLLAPVLEGLRYGSEADLAMFANALVERHGDEALNELSKIDAILRYCPTILDALRRRAKLRGVSEAAAADYRKCLVGYLKAERFGEAAEVLDRLEELASQRVGAREFQHLLAESQNQLERVWRWEDRAIARVGVLEDRRKINDAFTELDELFWHFFKRPNRLHDAEGILERTRRLSVRASIAGRLPGGVAGWDAEYYEARKNALAARTNDLAAEVADPVDRPPVKVLFVGGDERQEKAMEAVRSRVRRKAPHIEVEFVFPGWSGNWTRTLNDVRRKMKTHDAMALMRLVRTEFGRQCRKCCSAESKPWRSCWVAGQRAMADSIIAAANAAG